MSQKISQKVKTVITVICSFIILCSVVGTILLGAGVHNANRTGTFNLFGKSFHVTRSNDMAPAVGSGELIVVSHAPPTSFAQGDLVAFYQEKNGTDYLLVRRLVKVNGMEYTVADGAGNPLPLSAEDTRFLGTVQSKSAFLGKVVLFLQSEDGKPMFLWWSFGILFFIVGLAMLLHVILKNRRSEAPSLENADFESSEAPTFDSIDFDYDSDYDLDE